MKKTALITAIISATVATAGQSMADTTLSLQSAFPFSLGIIEASATRFAEDLNTVTEGEISVRTYDAGELSPPFEVLENVGNGSLDMGWSAAAYWDTQIPAAALFQGIPFGPDVPKYLAWLYGAGGLDLWRELYEPFNVVPVPCGSMVSEAGGWFTNEVNSLDDLQGVTMRISGLGARVVNEIGMSAASLPVGETYLSLDTGRIGAAEVSFPSIDVSVAFYEVADYYYFPGWHQPGSLNELIINADVWNGLTESQQRSIEGVCSDLTVWTYATDMNGQAEQLDYFRSQGVNVGRLPDEVIDALREASDVVLAQLSEDNADFARVLSSYREFSEEYDEYEALTDVTK